MKKTLRTNISQLNWCTLNQGVAEYRPAKISLPGDKKSGEISWLDLLLKGGLKLPNSDKPLSILLAGPPGSGKTTFALELCYELAKNEVGNSQALSTFYISTDQESNAIIQNAIDFGYKDIERYMQAISLTKTGKLTDYIEKKQGMIFVWGKEEIEKTWRRENKDQKSSIKIEDLTNMAFSVLNEWLLGGIIPPEIRKKIIDISFKRRTKKSNKYIPQILVVDSLNIITNEYQNTFFEEFMGAMSHESDIVIFIMDSNPIGSKHEIWEYASDMIIRLDYDSSQEYFLRSIEIIKARYQSHVWGKHQLKIYEDRVWDTDSLPTTKEEKVTYNRLLRRGHPFIEQGGIFIYPSIHYYLSRYKRHEYSDFNDFVNPKPDLKGTVDGFPKGRCIAFIGTRGGHKSHFGYLTCLNWIHEDPNRSALFISLRDDENTTRKTLKKIAKDEFTKPDDFIDNYIESDKLEILHFHPGYITPEEFFHRIFVHVKRHKAAGQDLIVLFNSLDQLNSRFPLCSKQQIFVPGIIEFFSGEDVTSIFIAVDEPGQPLEQYGLLPMADLIISFYPKTIEARNYLSHLESDESWSIKKPKNKYHDERIKNFKLRLSENIDLLMNIISLQVVRYAGGQRAGAEGILELVDKQDNLGLYDEMGLHYTKFSTEYDTGKLTHKKTF